MRDDVLKQRSEEEVLRTMLTVERIKVETLEAKVRRLTGEIEEATSKQTEAESSNALLKSQVKKHSDFESPCVLTLTEFL